MHNRALWVLQWLMGIYFIVFGVIHLVVPEGLPEVLSWMNDLSDTIHLVTAVAEILGGLGLILPSISRIRPELTPLAAVGLMVVMVGAAVFHIGREEYLNIGINVVDIAILAYIAYGRWRLVPIEPRTS